MKSSDVNLGKYIKSNSKGSMISRKSTGLSSADSERANSNLYNTRAPKELESRGFKTDSIAEEAERQRTAKEKLKLM